MNQLVELRRKPHLSISAVKTFLTCARKHSLQYSGVRPDYYPAALALGSAWHEVIAMWLTGETPEESLDEALRSRILERLRRQEVPVLFDDAEDNEEQFVARAVRMLAEFRRAIPRPKLVLGTELAFEMRLTH